MKLVELSHSCLMDILAKEIPFKLAIENICNKNTVFRDDRRNLTNVVGCSLRHFYIFDNLVSRLEKEFSEEQKVTLYIYLTNHLFVPLISSKDMDAMLEKYEIVKDDIDKINEFSKEKSKLIPEGISNDSVEYLHYRFNIPLWVLRMWMKHFKGYTYKIVKSVNKPTNHYMIKNPSKISDGELAHFKEFVPSPFEGLYLYQGNVGPLRHSLVRSNRMVLINPAEHYLYSKIDLDVLRRIAIYSEVQNNMHLQLEALLNNTSIDIIAGSSEAYYPTKKDVENFNLNKVNLYQTGHSSIITCLSEKVHTFFVLPKNTNFEELRKAPDYFNRIKQEELDGYIANQKLALHDASEFVEEGGQLVYAVSTMNKKETMQIADDFIKNHPDFVLVEQKQFLPFDKYDSTYYFAIFRKETPND